MTARHPAWGWAAGAFGVLAALGLADMLQTARTVVRNYPLLGHIRSLSESIGPNIRQYFIESDMDERPFSREQRHAIYDRSLREPDVLPFGTLVNVYGNDYEWINHSLRPAQIASRDFRITVGPERAQPYSASVFNISAMSFGSLSPNAIRALNEGARRGRFYHDTGEGSISRYHREHGGDIVWEIGSGYFGCRHADGSFDERRFAEQARDPQVRMIEIKLSQGAKPGHGGMLPGAKVTAEIAEARGIPVGQDCISPAAHGAFSTPLGLLQFVARLRELSGDKPVGFKLAIGHPWEWFGIAKAMRETGIVPDFIVVDGAEGGTGAAPLEFVNHMGAPLTEALLLVHNTLVGLDLRKRVRIGAAGKVSSAFDIARLLAMGADWCNAGRGFMFALGCIQSLRCHTDHCPSGVATQDPRRWRSLDATRKATRVYNFHQATLEALRELLSAAGLTHPDQLGPEHVIRRVSSTQVRSLASLYPYLEPGELLHGVPDHQVFRRFWLAARADAFSVPTRSRAGHAPAEMEPA
ncbi:FMN-binding glutamate synthase family protein [Coralloluteibacterium stylophorae]|uniref:FMN-binding glutamate synthase family protein n=2 Tax=Coralloluteibacterium stylophorae TaxID=1776034 RepID=A0A8J7VR80_9GAMM|nr:FMN-binding glutamate synthase family protein [Coralloluteibacterium stylophorae]MBS7455808.1 FMN-binding glutamate synthase family protein [Coralloluteibacterium stylophorae]